MAVASAGNVHGRMRRQIAVVGHVDHKRRGCPIPLTHFTRDKSLRALLNRGAVTPTQLRKAVTGFNEAPSHFAWLAAIDDALLEKADQVFLAKRGRYPIEDTDFHLNGDYNRICRSLQHDPHYYERHKGAHPAEEPNEARIVIPQPGRSQARANRATSRGIWAFLGVVLLGFGGTPLLAMLVRTYVPYITDTAVLLLGGLWLGILVGALVLTFPRRNN